MRIIYSLLFFLLVVFVYNNWFYQQESGETPSSLPTESYTSHWLTQKDNSGQFITVPVVPISFIARGTEPFWAFEKSATGAKYSAPGLSGVDEVYYTTMQTNSGMQIFVVATPIASGSNIQLILTPTTCSDGMSETIYNYKVSGTLGSGSLIGCAN